MIPLSPAAPPERAEPLLCAPGWRGASQLSTTAPPLLLRPSGAQGTVETKNVVKLSKLRKRIGGSFKNRMISVLSEVKSNVMSPKL